MNYPTTKEQWQEMLGKIEAQIKAQGNIVEARLLDRKRQIEKLIQDWD